ncbi:hypothetical protein PHBOTO_002144 [Pseudozyma hubeiensis]|nr:hypothetical protein PHBOTO_002144 [Pseudozyma hubeiensis]
MKGCSDASDRIPALPAELLSRVIASLVPAVDRNASTLPHPNGAHLDYTPALPSSPNGDLLSAALSSQLLHDLASHALYRTPLLRTLKSLNLLAATIAAEIKKQNGTSSIGHSGESSRATSIRSIHLPPGDGLLQPGDTLADQTCYVESLRILFDNASRLDFVSLDHRQAGAALLEFLQPSTVCRPRRITLSNLSFSAPPFSTTKSLAPLSKLTHLHLIKIVPPPALISFLVGEQINADEQGNVPRSIKAGLSPRKTLEYLRLSLLPPDALVEFEAYIAWRKAWKVYEKLSAQEQAREPAPRAPRGPARRFAVQEALYDLAVHSSCLPRLRLLLLELSPLGPLPSPMEEDREMIASRSGSTASSLRQSRSMDARATRADASHFHDAISSSRRGAARNILHSVPANGHSGGGLPQYLEQTGSFSIGLGPHIDQIEDAETLGATPEELRIGDRDNYWRSVESGQAALVDLWSIARRSADSETQIESSPEIRVVAARPNGHDRREGFQDFYCQAQHDPSTVTDPVSARRRYHTSASEVPTERGSRGLQVASEVGCWADPDIFSLVGTAPYLSFKSVGKSDHGWYWTGELPRETQQPSRLVIPSLVKRS